MKTEIRSLLVEHISDPTTTEVACLGMIVEAMKQSADVQTRTLAVVVNDAVDAYIDQVDRKN